jgi:hypothetical protein
VQRVRHVQPGILIGCALEVEIASILATHPARLGAHQKGLPSRVVAHIVQVVVQLLPGDQVASGKDAIPGQPE